MKLHRNRGFAALIVGTALALTSAFAQAETPQEQFNLSGGDLIKPRVPVGPPSLRKRAADGEPSAQFTVGTLLHDQDEPASRQEAVRWFERAARQGYPDAEYWLGLYHFMGWGGLAKDPATAATWFRGAAEQGHANAAYGLAELLYHGDGVRRDHATAVRWYTVAADRKHSAANYRLGVMHAHGQGVPIDHREAYVRYSLGARYGDGDAQYALGQALEHGQGTEKDLASAARYYEEASEQAILPAKLRLGELLLRGEGVPRNVPRGTKLIREAADLGLPLAQMRVGMLYLAGEHGFPRSDTEARRWFERAKAGGSRAAEQSLALMDEWETKQRAAPSQQPQRTPYETGREIGALLRVMQEANRASPTPSPAASSEGSRACRERVESRLVRCRTQYECLDCDYSWVCENRRSSSRCKPLNVLSYTPGEFFCDPENGERFDTREEVFANSCGR